MRFASLYVLLGFSVSACSALSQSAAPIIHHNAPPSSVLAAQQAVIAQQTQQTQPTPSQAAAAPIVVGQSSPAASPVDVYRAPMPTPIIAQAHAAPMPSKTPAIAAAPKNDDPPETYTVQAGDNLFRIALNNGLGYRELAELNGIENPDDIKVGQVLRIRSAADIQSAKAEQALQAAPPVVAAAAPTASTPERSYPKALKQAYSEEAKRLIEQDSQALLAAHAANAAVQTAQNAQQAIAAGAAATAAAVKSVAQASENAAKQASQSVQNAANQASAALAPATPPAATGDRWLWPIQGKILSHFTEQNKGIDIASADGKPVYAARAGKVVYSGSGLRGYGNLLIIKHDATFLSAYAHNRKLLVKEGDNVRAGQQIAEVGKTDTNQYKLHFEIRRFGKPVDPMTYLK